MTCASPYRFRSARLISLSETMAIGGSCAGAWLSWDGALAWHRDGAVLLVVLA